MKFDDALPAFRNPFHRQRKLVVYLHRNADSPLFARLHQHFPGSHIVPLQKQHFHQTAVFGQRVHTRGNDFGIVDDEDVPRLYIFFDIAENPVLYFLRVPVVNQQAGGIPRLRGRLGDQFVGQFVIKIALSILCLFFHNHKSLPFGIPSSFPAVFRYDSPRRVLLLLFLRDFIRPDRRGKTAFPPFC